MPMSREKHTYLMKHTIYTRPCCMRNKCCDQHSHLWNTSPRPGNHSARISRDKYPLGKLERGYLCTSGTERKNDNILRMCFGFCSHQELIEEYARGD